MIGDLREHTRTPTVKPIRYYAVVSDFKKLEKISDTALSVDISDGGIGILTGCLLEKGHVVIFENEIKTNKIKAKVAVVRWVNKIDGDEFRAGLKFVTH